MAYTVYGSNDLECLINEHMKLIAARIEPYCEQYGISAVILGGGYGRGEGGATRLEDGSEKLHNDYDFFVTSNNISFFAKRRLKRFLDEISREFTSDIGIDVDFSPPKNKKELKRMDFNMMWQELKHGNKVILGDEDVLKLLPDYDIKHMPAIEGVKLMLNRGAGLILSKEKMADSPDAEDLEFVRRNIYKAWNACGDICLISADNYHWSYVERLKKLEQYREHDSLVGRFFSEIKEALEYKLQPGPMTVGAEELSNKLEYTVAVFEEFNARILWSWLNCASDDPATVYAELERSCGGPDTTLPKAVLKNIILNILYIGLVHFNIKFYLKNPRHRLFCCLPQLLLDKTPKQVYTNNTLGIANGESLKNAKNKFIQLWKRFN